MLPPEVLEDEVDDPVVEVHAAEEGVAPGREHLEHVPGQLQHRDVERAAAEVVDEHLLVEPTREAVRQRGGGRLVHDSLDVETGELAGVAHREPLGVRVVRRHRDDRLVDLLLEERLRDLLDVREDESADLRERVDLAPEQHRRVAARPLDDVVRVVVPQLLHDLRVPLPADEPLRAVDRVLRVRDELVLRHAADEHVAALGERDDGGQDEAAPIGGDDPRDPAPDVGDARVRRPEVDADDRLLAGASHVPDP